MFFALVAPVIVAAVKIAGAGGMEAFTVRAPKLEVANQSQDRKLGLNPHREV